MTKFLEWTPALSVGIDAIDEQHKRIVAYINQLQEARLAHDRNAVAAVIDGLVDYTLSHFRFEEAILRKASYPMLPVHQKVHGLFIRRIRDYQQRFALGKDVSEELQETLAKWLVSHIKREDMDYSATVRARLSANELRELRKTG